MEDDKPSDLEIVRKCRPRAKCSYTPAGRWEVVVGIVILGWGKTAAAAWAAARAALLEQGAL